MNKEKFENIVFIILAITSVICLFLARVFLSFELTIIGTIAYFTYLFLITRDTLRNLK